MDELTRVRARVQAMLAEKRAKQVPPVSPSPRYDEVYFRGTAWLNALAAGELEPAEPAPPPQRPRRLSRRRKAILRRLFWFDRLPKDEWARLWAEYTRLLGLGLSPQGRPFRRKRTAARYRTSGRWKP